MFNRRSFLNSSLTAAVAPPLAWTGLPPAWIDRFGA